MKYLCNSKGCDPVHRILGSDKWCIDCVMNIVWDMINEANDYDELNRIAYYYWGTEKGCIKGVQNIRTMQKRIERRRKEIANQANNK